MQRTLHFIVNARGIPAGVVVTYYSPGTDKMITSRSEQPNDPEEVEFELLDRKGYQAPWLEKTLKPEDWSDIQDQVLEKVRETLKGEDDFY